MASLSVNALMKNLAKQNFGSTIVKPSIIDRTHFSGPSGGSYHHHSSSSNYGGGKKNSIALSALTLLSFLFFLNILQNCLQDNMQDMNPQQQVIIMQARLKAAREAAAQKRKGEVQLLTNSSTRAVQESRLHPEPKRQMAQIPVKLKTSNNRP